MATKITEHIYWVGTREASNLIHCNPYLIVEDGEGALIDPGPITEFERIKESIESIIPLDRISLIVANHPDPDICGAIPSLWRAGLTAPVAAHWRSATLIRFYGLDNDFYVVNENGWEWSFRSGRKLRFIPSPYCHFPGSVMTYDAESATLFSGDLFGSINSSQELFADSNYLDGMRSFHEHYMPSHAILAPVMDSILPLKIDRIASQHGQIIAKDTRNYILELRNLKCGTYLGNTEAILFKESDASLMTVIQVINHLLSRLGHTFGTAEVRGALEGSEFALGSRSLALESIQGEVKSPDPISRFLDRLVRARGSRWLTLIEPYLYTLLEEYRLPLPAYIRENSAIAVPSPEKDGEAQDRILHDRNTGFLTGAVYRQHLASILGRVSARAGAEAFSVLYFSADNLEEINQLRGRKAGDEAIRSLAYLVKNNAATGEWKLFKLDMPYVAAIAEGLSADAVRAMANKVRDDAAEVEFTADRLTISVGILHGDQLRGIPEEKEVEYVDRVILARLFRARKTPSGGICDYLKDSDTELYLRKKILLVEPDDSYVRFLEPFFAERGYLLMTMSDGSGVSELRDEDVPDLVIAEAMTPRLDGFALRNRMLVTSRGKNTPFILISRRKDEEFIKRAASVGILHFLKKPFSKTELLGLVDNLLRQK